MTSNGAFLSPVLPAISLVASLLAATLARLAQEHRRADSATDDTEAAQRLLDYYCFLQHDYRTALYWARVCASHGSADCAKSAKTLRDTIREQGL